ncbi:MAG: PHP domain-containing protein [Micrococcales bacterium]|nr:PHP domain-containing protein [Micrococcales bacterium]
MRIDLHAHSDASDGTMPPRELVAAAGQAGLDVVAITDHDTTAGWAEAAEAARELGVGLVRGLEMSTWYHGGSVHLLCYLPDPDDPGLAAELASTRAARVGRVQQMVTALARDYPITFDDVTAQATSATTLGRPHIAAALVANGVVADWDEAFTTMLASDSPYYEPYQAIDTAHAIAVVRAAGGVPVVAHPASSRRGPDLPDDAFAGLAAAGLAGLEVHHRDHSAAQVQRLTTIATRLGLLVTGSSDFHGSGKANRLGENLTDPVVLEAIAAQGATEVIAH